MRWCGVCDAEVVLPGERCECGALVDEPRTVCQACTVCDRLTVELSGGLAHLTGRDVVHNFETYGPHMSEGASEEARLAVWALMVLASEQLVGHEAQRCGREHVDHVELAVEVVA